MENSVIDETTESVSEPSAVSEAQDTVAELKAKMHSHGEGDVAMSNHVGIVDEKHTNGHGHVMNNIDAKPKEPTKEQSSSKSKEHHSSSSSKHKEHSSSSSKHRDDSSRSKDHKHRDDKHKDKHREGGSSSSSSKDKHRESSSSKDKHRESSSSSKDKHREGGSSSKDKHKEGSSSSSKDKHKDGSSSSSKDKHKDGSSSSSKDKYKDSSSSSSKDKHKESSSSSSKDKSVDGSSHSSKSKDGEKHSSSHKEKHREDKDKHRDKEKRDEKEKNREGKDKSREEKDRSREDREKIKESKDKSREEKEKSREHKEKHREDKEKSKEHKDKHREDKEKSRDHKEKREDKPKESSHASDKHSKESSKHKDKNIEPKDGEVKSPKIKTEIGSGDGKVKKEPVSPSKQINTSVSVSPAKQVDTSIAVKKEIDSDDDAPLALRLEEQKKSDRKVKAEKRTYEESSDDEPLSSRAEKVKKIKKEEKSEKVSKKRKAEDDEFSPEPKKSKQKSKVKKEKNDSVIKSPSPTKAQKKKEEEKAVWKWWEEEKRDDGVKWNFLEHKGPVFAPDYERLPKDVKFLYDGKEMQLSEETEEVAGFFAKMLEHDYTTRKVFQDNFFKDWRKVFTPAEKEKITDLKKCDFRQMHAFFVRQSEERKNRTKEEKKKLKEQNEELMKEYGFCKMDGHVEKIGNFRIEPPGLFRGRGEHPKQGMLKKRVIAENVIINCSKDAVIPPPPKGHKWKEVRHDNTVSWLACWTENVQGQTKYVMLNAASRLKGEKDWQKYEVARRLNKQADKIRAQYREDWKSKEMRIRQRAVALYFIDKLALRAGNEKEEGETADTVGCCSLRVEHLTLYEEKDGKPFVVEFDFLGKDSIRYFNSVAIEKKAFKNLQLFMENKSPGDDLFDRLNTTILNKHLHDLMDGLTAKVFRTFNASKTLQEQLDILTVADDPVSAKFLSYNRANRAVAILCNHQRAVPKNFDKQMENLQTQIDAKRQTIKEAKKALKNAKIDYKAAKSEKNRKEVDKRKKAVERLEDQLNKLEIKATDKDENKEIALGTSKLNYLDPRISVAWCKKWEVPIEKIYNKTQRDKFRWAIDMAGPEFSFTDEPSEVTMNMNEDEGEEEEED